MDYPPSAGDIAPLVVRCDGPYQAIFKKDAPVITLSGIAVLKAKKLYPAGGLPRCYVNKKQQPFLESIHLRKVFFNARGFPK